MARGDLRSVDEQSADAVRVQSCARFAPSWVPMVLEDDITGPAPPLSMD